MNCKQGDLAIVVGGENAGAVVMCLRYVGSPPFFSRRTDCWETDRALQWFTGNEKNGMYRYAPDSELRPIRDSDRTDEIIERIGKPVKETT